MKTCPKCNGKYFDNDEYCSDCNIKLVDNNEYRQIISELQNMTYDEREQNKNNPRYRIAYKYYYGDSSNYSSNKNASTPQPTPKNVPKCPTCGSTNVEKISTAKKAFGFAMVGLFSSNLGKTMECKNCGYKW